ncbi:MAG TPA: RES family NAD+ phosphorylase [Ferruginibacter sp.]|nr:RES family NAD+ phosphorylase [Ferruginibacter sp.]HPH91363.1 RES family NAD+ phosphorylase [Ferruginibacter sp.]
MMIYRLATGSYKDDISGTGAKIFGGRWNSPGMAVLYTAENISLALLEILVRTGRKNIPSSYSLLKLSVPDTVRMFTITETKLKRSWEDDLAYTQWMGDELLKARETLLLKVPSAIVPEENNLLLNPTHSDYKKVKIISTSVFDFDKRLFLKNE